MKCPITHIQGSLPEVFSKQPKGLSLAQARWLRKILPTTHLRECYLGSRRKSRMLSDSMGNPLASPRQLLKVRYFKFPKRSHTRNTTVAEELSAATLSMPGNFHTIWEPPSLIYVGPITKELRIRTLPRPFSTSNSSSRFVCERNKEIQRILGPVVVGELEQKLGQLALQRVAAILDTCLEHKIDPRFIRWGV